MTTTETYSVMALGVIAGVVGLFGVPTAVPAFAIYALVPVTNAICRAIKESGK